MKFIKNKKMILILVIIFVLIVIILLTGGARTDVYLKDYDVTDAGEKITLYVGVSSSSGYVRKMKRTSGSMNYYLTFYSTYLFNSKIGAEDTFVLEIDDNVDEIYFYAGDNGYNKVLEKDSVGNWVKVINDTGIKNIVDKTDGMNDFVCPEALEGFYEDNEYSYYFNCIKEEYVVVEYFDGTEETVREALKNGRIKISDLDSYKIKYLKYEKE